MMEKLLTWNFEQWDIALLLLRLAVGIGSFVHGAHKIGKVSFFAASHHLPHWLAHIATWVQIICSVCLVVGFATFPASLGLVIFYIVATQELIVRKKEPFAGADVHTWDIGVMYLVIPLAILLAGPGRYSVDAVLFAH
jgi:putative oxidoreductase